MAPPPPDLFGKDGKSLRHYMGPEHVFDFPSLIIDNPVASQRKLNLVDLDVTVYGLDEIQGSTLPIGVIVSCCVLLLVADHRFSRTAAATRPRTWSRWRLVSSGRSTSWQQRVDARRPATYWL
jgi:hypothetical protein